MILTLRTDKPEAEVGLYHHKHQVAYKKWQAHRELSDTIHHVILNELRGVNKGWEDIDGIIFYKGPGSFTGLRIGAALANAYATAQGIPVVAINGEDWVEAGHKALLDGHNELALPEYGSEPRVTQQKK